MPRKAKIICTIGPASIKKEILFSLIRGGMDVARLNFSHGDYAFHKRAIELIREGSKKYKRPVGILQDLQGIKIRTGPMEGGAITLKKGRPLLVEAGSGTGDGNRIFITYPGLIRDAKAGDRILLDDGLLELKVAGKTKDALRTVVIEGGVLRDRKGVNLPGITISASSFTEKDRADLDFGLSLGVDFVAVSFVREAGDIKKVREYIKKTGGYKGGHSAPLGLSPSLIAKIEKPEALLNIEAIIEEADGVMVARGDLGVEVAPEDVPLIQKALIEKANVRGKPVITATQMLESMTAHRRPTRAEAADVANAVLDGTDALMLSGETSAGKYPLEALSMMQRIIRSAEGGIERPSYYAEGKTFSEAVAEAAVVASENIGARLIVAFTQSGYTARLLSMFRPRTPIVAFTPSEAARRLMSLYWGVTSMTMRPIKSTDELFNEVDRALLKEKAAKRGEGIVITASTPLGGAGKTNLLKLHRIP